MGKTHTPADVASQMEISPSTLRKYCLLLEENGLNFKRNAKNSRQFTDSDIMTLQRMITLMKTDGVTVENAAYSVSLNTESINTGTGKDAVIYNDRERHNDDITGVTLNEIRKLKDEIKEQREIIDGFRVAQEKRDAYFVEILESLQGKIDLLNEQAALPEPEKEPESTTIPGVEKKGFFRRLFK